MSKQNFSYFPETEQETIDRTGLNYSTARNMRRELSHRLTGEERVVPGWLKTLELNELLGVLGWQQNGNGFLIDPNWKSSFMGLADSYVRSAMCRTPSNTPGYRKGLRRALGLPISTPSYGYIPCKKHTETSTKPVVVAVTVDQDIVKHIAKMFDVAADDGYQAAADYANEMGFLSRTGKNWTRHTARDTVRNPEYAGYPRCESERTSFIAFPGLYESIVSFDLWIDANLHWIQDNYVTLRFEGWRCLGDKQLWALVPQMASSEYSCNTAQMMRLRIDAGLFSGPTWNPGKYLHDGNGAHETGIH